MDIENGKLIKVDYEDIIDGEFKFPEGVTEIGSGAFQDCSNLTSIEIPEGVESISGDAFSGCSKLTNVRIPTSVKIIESGAFQDCSNLTSIEIPEGVESISGDAFSGCSKLTNIKIPTNVKRIENGTFADCSSLTSIEIPEGVESISGEAFYGCSKLTNIKIPTSVKIIGSSAFQDCSNLTSIEIPEGVKEICWNAFRGCSKLTNIKVPTSVKRIESSAFQDCSNLTSIEIPEGVESILGDAFSGCSKLTNIKIPTSIKIIGSSAFKDCINLTSIEIPDGVEIVSGEAFYGCSKLTNIKIPTSVKIIGSSAFQDCSNLTSIEIPEGVKEICWDAFRGCSKLTNINVPTSVKRIASRAFQDCSNLTSIEIPEGVESISEEAFYGCSKLTNIKIPTNVKRIEKSTFAGCSSLTSIEIPEGVESISEEAFYGCSKLTNIKIPTSVKIIESGAFQDCSNLTSIEFPEGVEEIKNGAFRGCSKLTNIKIPTNVKRIEKSTFAGCSSLTSIEIPEGVESISEEAFYGCSKLTNIKIPTSVKRIESGAFQDCSNLTSIEIPTNVKRIEKSAFAGCSSLTSIEFPEGVEEMEDEIFEGCSSLKKIKIPNSLKDICETTFKGCSGLEQIEVNEDNPMFKNIDGVLYVVSDCAKAVMLYPSQKKDLLSYTVLDGTEGIIESAFEGCSTLKEVRIPSSVTYLGKNFFDYNSIMDNKENDGIILSKESVKKSGIYIPYAYIQTLIENQKAKQFLETTDFRAFNSNISNLKELLSKYSSEEQMDFFKFAVCLGCFSKEKTLDQNLKGTEATVGQKASALLAKLIKTPELELGKYHGLFDSLSFEAKASQEFLKFITPQGKKNDNLELLVRLESECPGIFAKTISGFNEAQKYRKTLDDDGTTKTVSWEEALKKFYAETKYVGITEETQDIAETYGTKGLKQEIFDRGVELRKQAQREGIPSHILGKEIKELSILEKIEQLKQRTAEELGETQEILDDLYSKQFTYEWLDKTNAKNGIMGLYVSCCGTITSHYYGRRIAESSITKRDVQNLVVKDAKGEIISKGTIYIDEEHGYGVFNDFELNEKYREHEDRSNGYGGKYEGDDKDESELTESQKKQREERNLIFNAFQRGMEAFIEEYDKQHPGNPMKQINVGMGYNRLKRNVEQFEETTELLTVPAEYSFEDASRQQFILYKREEKKMEKAGQQEENEIEK